MKKKIVFIVNPISGRHNKSRFPQIVDNQINKDLFDYSIIFTEYGGHATELAKKAIEDDIDIVAAVGGDGTINEIASPLIGTRQALAIIPFGSGNGLARHLHLSLKPERVIKDVINNGIISKIDTATVNGMPFISIAGIGFDALVANFFANDPRRGLKTYLKFITEEYPRFKPNFYHVILDSGLEFDCKPLFVSFANSNQFGFNASVSPKASLNDGMLDVCIFKKPNILEVGYVAERLITNKIDKTQFVDIYKAKSIRVIREKDDFVNIDGEAVMMQKDIEIVNNHLSLNILLPNNN